MKNSLISVSTWARHRVPVFSSMILTPFALAKYLSLDNILNESDTSDDEFDSETLDTDSGIINFVSIVDICQQDLMEWALIYLVLGCLVRYLKIEYA